MPFSKLSQSNRRPQTQPAEILPVVDAAPLPCAFDFETTLSRTPKALEPFGLTAVAFTYWPITGSERCFIHAFDPHLPAATAAGVLAAVQGLREHTCVAAIAEPDDAPRLALVAGPERRGAAACLVAIATDPALDRDGLTAALRHATPAVRVLLCQLCAANRKFALLPKRKRPTAAESDCLFELCLGLRPEQIAERLGKSKRTVENQIRTAQKRLDASTRDEAVAMFLSLGLGHR